MILGIDPGVSGAIAVLDDDGVLVAVHDMPTTNDGAKNRRAVNAPLLVDIVKLSGADRAFFELVGVRPGEGAVGAFAFGRSRGVVEGVLAACDVSIEWLPPAKWKRIVRLQPGADKDSSRAEAIRRWPSKASLFARKMDDGRGEAALIGAAGLHQEREG